MSDTRHLHSIIVQKSIFQTHKKSEMFSSTLNVRAIKTMGNIFQFSRVSRFLKMAPFPCIFGAQNHIFLSFRRYSRQTVAFTSFEHNFRWLFGGLRLPRRVSSLHSIFELILGIFYSCLEIGNVGRFNFSFTRGLVTIGRALVGTQR